MDISVSHPIAFGTETPVLDRRRALLLARRGAAPAAIGAVAGAVLAYGIAASLPKSYTAQAALAVEGDQIAIPELRGALRSDAAPDPMPWVRTEVQALTGRQLLAATIAAVHLDQDPEFNSALRRPGFFDHLKAAISAWFPHAAAPAGDNADLIVAAVDRALVVSQDNRSLVIGVDFTAHDPRIAAAFVNTLIGNYIHERAEQRSRVNAGANSDLEQRVARTRAEIDAIEKRMQDLRTSSQFVGLRAGSVGQQQLEDLATAVSRATLERMQLEATLARANGAAASGNPGEMASVLGSETISRLRDQETSAAAHAANLSARFGPAYPEVQSADADLAATRRALGSETGRIIASLQTQLRVARAHEADVQAEFQAARRSSVAAQNIEAEMEQLKQDAATRRDLYRTLLDREQQTAARPAAARTPDLRILSAATPPELPSKPNKKLAAGFGALAGAMLGFGGLLAARAGADPVDPERFGGLAGADPVIVLRGRGAGFASRIFADPDGADASMLRQFRNRLRPAPRARGVRVLGFIGACSTKASSDLALAFARLAALDGKRVLLIGAGTAATMPPGGDWRRAIARDTVPTLHTAALVWSAQDEIAIENWLAEARDDYDLVVCAGLAGEEAAVVAARVDVPVLVVEKATPQSRALESAKALRGARGGLAAIVLRA